MKKCGKGNQDQFFCCRQCFDKGNVQYTYRYIAICKVNRRIIRRSIKKEQKRQGRQMSNIV